METTPEDKKKAYQKAYYQSHKNFLLDKQRKYYQNNSSKCIEKSLQKYKENKELRRSQMSKNYRDNSDERKLYAKNHRLRNIEYYSKYNKAYRMYRLKNDPIFKTLETLRNRIRMAILSQSTKKFGKSAELIGCSPKEVAIHLESKFKEGMSWENHGSKGWHIDHIIPCASFDLSDPEEQKKCFHYTNLQPLWWYENMSKGDKILQTVDSDK